MTGSEQSAGPCCSVCSRPSVIRLRDPDRHLCAEHFCSDLTGRVKRAVGDRKMISGNDRIAVALSGGKDSTALLLLLNEILLEKVGTTLVAITIDEGIAGYRDETILSAARLARDLGIEHRIITFRDLFGKDLDEILVGRVKRACSICGILRRKALSSAAKDAGADKIATGHNLDDEAQSVLMNVFRGDLTRLVRYSGSGARDCFLPRIKPLMGISEKEIAVYLMVKGHYPELPDCPYTKYALRAEIRTYLNILESVHHGTMRNLVEGNGNLRWELNGISPGGEIARCRECGEPCSGTLCQTCLLIKRLLG